MKKLKFKINKHDPEEYICKVSGFGEIALCIDTVDEYFNLPYYEGMEEWDLEEMPPNKIFLQFSEREIEESYFIKMPDLSCDLQIEGEYEEYLLGPARKWLRRYFPHGCYVRCEYEPD